MPEPRIGSIGRAVPDRRYTQEELYEHRPWPATPLLDKLFLESPVAERALFVPPDFYRVPRSLGETNAAWRAGALALGGAALREILVDVDPRAVDLLSVTTVTGYATPGLDLLLAKEHGLRDDIARLHLNCIGCHAAIPLLRSVADHVARHPERLGVALAVEICSACFADATTPENLVALSLFGDGAAAVTVSSDGDGPALVGFASVYDYEHQEALGFDLSTTGFRIVLDPGIPDVIARSISRCVDRLLSDAGATRSDVHIWCFHPGGSRILDAVQRALGLPDEAMRSSRRVLRAYGNMSSPSVLFVLAEALATERPPVGALGVMASFGPGLGIEACLLRF